jgi:predicted negative regulator of RcsB-dependent stress response
MSPSQTIESGLDTSDSPQSFADWFQLNSRLVGIGAVILVLAAAGAWYYMSSAQLKRANAERGLTQAKQSMAAGNAALAQSDLQKVVDKYQGTPSGGEAAMILAQMKYDQGKFEDGLKVLSGYRTRSSAGENLGPIMSLVGDGLVGTNKLDDAASAYGQAADATRRPGERALYRAQQARTLMLAGKNADARNLWLQIKDDTTAAGMRTEALIRLGEIEAKTAGQTP